MNKIGILTLYYNNDNYGGIAQAYALQNFLEKEGFETEIISYKRTTPPMFVRDKFRDKPINYIKSKGYKFPQKISERIKNKITKLCLNRKLKDNINKRKKAFEKSREMIPHSDIVFTDETIKDANNYYDCFISGSDQIWKPGVIRAAFVCDFVQPEKKRFSYASSIAVSRFPEEYSKFMKQKLQPFCWISVREELSSKYLSKLLGRNVDVTVDPTLLLSEIQWDEITSDRIVDDDYIFVYLLGQSVKQRKNIKEYAKKNGKRIVFLPHIDGKVRYSDINFGDINLYDIDLPAFFSLIKYSDSVITDSFHAVVFSIIFRKQFVALDRIVLQANGDMGSRLSTLLENTDLSERRLKSNNFEVLEKKIDYAKVKNKLVPIINESKQLLIKVLKDEK